MVSNVIRALSTYSLTQSGMFTVKRARSDLETVGIELATGLKADVSKSLGMRATSTLSMRSLLRQTDDYILANKLADAKLTATNTTISKLKDEAMEASKIAIQTTADPKAAMSPYMQAEAVNRLQSVMNFLNTSYNGDYIFAGVNSETKPLRGYTDIDPVSGKSPLQAISDIVNGDVTSEADALAKIAEIDSIFDGTHPDPALRFESLFYQGTPERNANGDLNPRIRHMADDVSPIEIGVQANDKNFREVLKGLFMLAAADQSKFTSTDGYMTYVNKAALSLATGIDDVTTGMAVLGSKHAQVATAIDNQEDKRVILNNDIVALEGVDPFEAQARMEALTTQLNATYSATSRMQGLSFLNYMR